tara:strand:+ start:206 stop:943 length:738 start_codon:yes stop_codon:yes gene_type:complete
MDSNFDYILFPVTVCDNFYDDPDSVREFALNQEYDNKLGVHPGLRSRCISTIAEEFHHISYHKILSMFGDYSQTCDPTNYGCYSYFQKIWRFSDDPKDPVNDGWIHNDGLTSLAAVVYLDPDPVNDNGTSVYIKDYEISEEELITPKNRPQWYDDVLGNEDLCGVDSLEPYRKSIVKNNNRFSLTIEVKNRYNRVIVYDGKQWHGQSNYWMPNEDDFRLAQVFFFFEMNIPNILAPKVRCKSYGI